MLLETKLITIGASKWIKIPEALLLKYSLKENLVFEELEDGLLIRARDSNQLSWEETYKALAEEQEDWSDWQAIDRCG